MSRFIVFIIFILSALSLSAETINVPADYATIQLAICASVDQDSVLVYPGTYYENIDFGEKSITIGSLFQITGDHSYISQTIIDGSDQGRVVVIDNNEPSDQSLIGLTITNGNAVDDSLNGNGGGIYVRNSLITMEALRIIGNRAEGDGGGIFTRSSQGSINNTDILDNYALSGGGIFNRSYDFTMSGNIFRGNHAQEYGGGLHIYYGTIEFKKVLFTENMAEKMGGGLYITQDADAEFDNEELCSIYNNSIGRGCGADIYSAANIIVIVDTFTVMQPTDFHASPSAYFEFDIQHSMQEQISADLYVSPDGDDNNSGLSTDDPLQTIHHACNMIIAGSDAPHTIHLAEGIYSPSISGEKFPINLPDYVSMFGLDGAEVILDAEGTGGVIRFVHIRDLSIGNMTITGGNANVGGGIYCYDSHPEIENVKIIGNSSDYGGGIGLEKFSYPLIFNVVIRDNQAAYNGGGIYSHKSFPTINSAVINNNSSEISGGGIYSYCGAPVLSNVQIAWNSAFSGGGLYHSSDCDSYFPQFDAENRCSIYLNNTSSRTFGSDLYSNIPISVIVDTFTVLEPQEYHAANIENYTFDILHGIYEQTPVNLYVSPDGDDENSGLSWKAPLKTICKACEIMITDSLDQRVIHLAEGIYSPSLTGEIFPVSIPSYVTLLGQNQDAVILDAECGSSVMKFLSQKHVVIKNLTITNGYSDKGGGVLNLLSGIEFINVTIKDNYASLDGGGIYELFSTPVYRNVIFTGNVAERSGGASYAMQTTSKFINTTISGNQSEEGGALTNIRSAPWLINSIVWDNGIEPIIFLSSMSSSNYIFRNSLIEGGLAPIDFALFGTVHWLDGNIDEDPLFVDTECGNYRLRQASPCIDAGTAYFEFDSDVLIDLDEDDWWADFPDIGAYEYGIDSHGNEMVPGKIPLYNYPNPFNPETTIFFALEQESLTELNIYNLKGQLVRRLLKEIMICGEHDINWDGNDNFGNIVRSGLYLVKLKTEQQSIRQKIMLIK